MKKCSLILLLMMSALAGVASETREPKVQLAILLDTSGSMDGLIEQAKTRLWDIVNEMALARKNGRMPELEVALYEYGKSTIPQSQGYLARLVDLTTDLDQVSEALFALQTNGGDEYCAQVIRAATLDLQWSKHPEDFKAIFIAGNEPFDQGKYPYARACQGAIDKGIVVNTIFCGNENEGIRTFWKRGAELADGRFMVIDHNQVLEVVSAPQDDQILKLSEELNKTYVAYGAKGKESKDRQAVQDAKAAGASKEAGVKRAFAKSSKVYKTKKWDLVSAAEEDAALMDQVAEEELPEEMQAMEKEERKEYVKAKAKQRQDLNKRIKELKTERARYLASVKKKNREESTLDSAVRNVVRKQMTDQKFEFQKEDTPQN